MGRRCFPFSCYNLREHNAHKVELCGYKLTENLESIFRRSHKRSRGNKTETRMTASVVKDPKKCSSSSSIIIIVILIMLIIILYIYHALINALGVHMIHIKLNLIFCTHLEHSPTKTTHIKCTETHTHTHARTHARTPVKHLLHVIVMPTIFQALNKLQQLNQNKSFSFIFIVFGHLSVV